MYMSTYRFQLREDGPTFSDVEDLGDYLSWLGISHVYLSPILKARKGSTHGYDVVDYVVSDALGGKDSYTRMRSSLHQRGIGVILDVVPNHMAVSTENWRLMDVLRNGRGSKWSTFFDWWGDVITLPILEDSMEKVKGLISVDRERREVVYRDWRLPLCDDATTVEEVMDKCYKLSWWIDGPSYRRFFYVNCLIGVNVEKEEVFREQVKDLPEADGVRIDHIDGLFDPVGYVEKMREMYPLVLVEKILTWGERLQIPAHGTTGYDFLNYVNHLLVEGENEEKITRVYQEFTHREDDLNSMIRESKRKVIREYMRNEFSHVAELASRSLGRDVSEEIYSFAECLPVYRVYGELQCDPKGVIRELRDRDPWVYGKLQQILPGAFAKGIEDTVFYRFMRLMSINEVGGFLDKFGVTGEEFHSFISSRGEETMNATSTHDTKMSEDVRGRIDYLSEIPEEWGERIRYWRDLLKPRADPVDEYRFYQALVGSLEEFSPSYKERMKAYMLKAMRESKERTTWERPNQQYEDAVMSMIEDAFSNASFKSDVSSFVEEVDLKGKEKSIVMVSLKVMSPGIADFYQGNEVWNYSLVDPDNRRKVDFHALRRMMGQESLDLRSPLSKVTVIRRLLHAKRKVMGAGYEPIRVGKGYVAFKRGEYTVVVRTRSRAERVSLNVRGKDILRDEYVDHIDEDMMRFPVMVVHTP